MKRELKFRTFSMEKMQQCAISENGWAMFGRFQKSSVPVMQFTGVFDKNGKEIYEGDILKWTYGDYEKPCITEVTYIINAGKFDIPTDADGNIIEVEIIGNIYENQEIINEKV